MQSIRAKQIIELLSKARVKNGISQQKVADYIGVTRRTVQNWENDFGHPDLDQTKAWCEAIGENPMIIFTLFICGDAASGNPRRSQTKRELVIDYIQNKMSDEEIDILYFLFSGVSGSSPYAYMQKVGADLSCPIGDRVKSARLIQSNYELALGTDNTMPYSPRIDNDAFEYAVVLGRESALQNNKETRGAIRVSHINI